MLTKIYLDSCEFLQILIHELSMSGDKADNPATQRRQHVNQRESHILHYLTIYNSRSAMNVQ